MRSTLICACFLLACSSASSPAASPDDAEVVDTAMANEAAADDSASFDSGVTAMETGTTTMDAALDTPSLPGADRTFTFVNSCDHPVWVGALANPEFTVPFKGGFALAAGESHAVAFPEHWGGRFWGRTGCVFDASGKGSCATGDCGGKLECNGAGGKPPASLAEFLLSGAGGKDFYDVSLVDGYNLPIGIEPVAGSFTKSSGDMYDCGDPSCTSDLNDTCPTELQVKSGKDVVACLSACEKFGTDEYCCRGAHDKPETCPPTDYSKTFKAACPTAYSYAYDDKASTFTCKGADYVIRFCP